MILVDSSVWIDHLRDPVAKLVDLVEDELILIHPFVIGEIALGSLKERGSILADLDQFQKAVIATDEEVLTLVERKKLFGIGIGYGDAHVLASTLLTEGTTLWTFDRRLRLAAERLNCAADLPGRQVN